MEGQDWKSKAAENQAEAQQLTRWVESEVQLIEEATAQLNLKKFELKEEVRQLRTQIAQQLSQTVNPDLSSLSSELKELKRIKQENQSSIDQLKTQIQLRRAKNKISLSTIESDKSLSLKFDKAVQTYVKLQRVQQMMEMKAKLISSLLSQVGQAKQLDK